MLLKLYINTCTVDIFKLSVYRCYCYSIRLILSYRVLEKMIKDLMFFYVHEFNRPKLFEKLGRKNSPQFTIFLLCSVSYNIAYFLKVRFSSQLQENIRVENEKLKREFETLKKSHDMLSKELESYKRKPEYSMGKRLEKGYNTVSTLSLKNIYEENCICTQFHTQI